MTPVGARVGAIRNADDTTVYMFGYGVFVGREPCPIIDGFPNPKVQLDDGGVVWGCECWWGPEDQIKRKISDRAVVIVPIPDRTEAVEAKP